jgi:hypothetical protein
MNIKTLQAGDKIKYKGSVGQLLTDPNYFSSGRAGLHYAKIRWTDGVIVNFCLNRLGVEKLE